jgi:lysozyme family protein
MAFEDAVERVLGHEGGYANDPKDSGGETIWGTTARVARACGYTGEMRDMPRKEAKRIYKIMYWDALRLDDVDALSTLVAYELFDTAVNQGVERAGTFLQRTLNVLNREGQMYADIEVDGRVGPVTIACLKEYLGRRRAEGVSVLLRALNCLQGAFYIELAERRPKDERFVYGWLLNRVS